MVGVFLGKIVDDIKKADMTVRPCGVYVRAFDLRNAVSGTSNVSRQMIDETLCLMNKCWAEDEIVDVMLMAEQFWTWQREMTRGDASGAVALEFSAIMERIKDSRIVPTVATFAQNGTKSEIQEIVANLKDQKTPKTNKDVTPTH